MEREFDTTALTRFVSDLYGAPVDVSWGDSRNMPEGTLGQANCYLIRLHSSLARNNDPRLPRIFLHELGHVLLHKTTWQRKFDLTEEAQEKESELFATKLLADLGVNFVWDAMRGTVVDYDWYRAKRTILNLAASTTFRKNQLPQPYQSQCQPDVEINARGQRRTTTQPQRMTATGLEAQAQREMALAAKGTDPKVAAMIRKSAQSKLEASRDNGRQSLSRNQVVTPMEFATPYQR